MACYWSHDQRGEDTLTMALKNRIYPHRNVIHHSDRGMQYCCPDYSEFAQSNNMILSTTEKYDPYENAVAERINGILKYEFGLIKTIPDVHIANKMVAEAVKTYNAERRHRSLEMKHQTLHMFINIILIRVTESWNEGRNIDKFFKTRRSIF